MTDLQRKIDLLLQKEDIEGLIELGTPRDEYSFEAETIAAGLEKLKESEITRENVTAVIVLTWMQGFNLSEDDMLMRMPAIERITEKIIGLLERKGR